MKLPYVPPTSCFFISCSLLLLFPRCSFFLSPLAGCLSCVPRPHTARLYADPDSYFESITCIQFTLNRVWGYIIISPRLRLQRANSWRRSFLNATLIISASYHSKLLSNSPSDLQSRSCLKILPSTSIQFFLILDHASSALHPQAVTEASLASFRALNGRVEAVGLYSANEHYEEVATKDAPYLLLPYAYAEVIQRQRTTSRLARLRVIAEAEEQLKLFTKLVERMLPDDERKLFSKRGKGLLGVIGMDASKKREMKIKQFQKEKELKDQIMVCLDLFSLFCFSWCFHFTHFHLFIFTYGTWHNCSP